MRRLLLALLLLAATTGWTADKTVTVMRSGGTYTTLAGAIAGEVVANANLVTMDGNLTISIEGDWSGAPDTAEVSTAGFTTSEGHELYIQTDAANKFHGKWDTTKYILQVNVTLQSILLATDYVNLIGLQIENTNADENSPVVNVNGVGASNVVNISNCGIKGGNDTSHWHIGIATNDADAVVNIWNCVIWNIDGTNASSRGIAAINATTVTIENCTVWGGYIGINNGANNRTKAINCLVGNTANVTFYDYTWITGGGYNASDDAEADHPGSTGHVDNVSVTFVNAAAGDFHLAAGDTDVIDKGTSGVTLGFTDDVDGVTRSGTWDIGADEYVAAGGGSSIAVIAEMHAARRRK